MTTHRPDKWRVGVVVPARNEERTIDACLESIRSACDAASALIERVSIVVVADSCDDDTASLAAAHPGVHVCEIGHASVGAARSVGSDLVVAELGGPLDSVWLANTDGDSVVAPDWLTRQLLAASRGIAGIAGVVSLLGGTDQLRRSFSRMYSIGITRDSHAHVHGTNLGVRGDALYAAGNWASIATGEDHDLWGRLGAEGFSRSSDPSLVVSTSARRVGRAPLGFAGVLDRLVSTSGAGA